MALPSPVVTVTDDQRVVWTGCYSAFERQNIDRLSVSEFCILWAETPLTVQGLAGPLCISLRHARQEPR